MVSESVSVSNLRPRASIASRSSRKFSMMPLWTMATRPEACGWALVSLGWPWVAQRVWPMPTPAFSGSLAHLGVEVGQLARRAQALQLAAFQQGDAGRIIAAVFQPLQRLHQAGGRRLVAEDTDNAAHMR